MLVIQETDYLVNFDDEEQTLIFTIKPKDGEPGDAKLFYDGKEHAVLQRDENTFVVLDYLPKKIIPTLLNSVIVGIVEFDPLTGDDIKNIYTAPVKITTDLPIDLQQLITTEQVNQAMQKIREGDSSQ